MRGRMGRETPCGHMGAGSNVYQTLHQLVPAGLLLLKVRAQHQRVNGRLCARVQFLVD